MYNQIKISNSLKFIFISFVLFFGSIAFAATYNVNSIRALEGAVSSANPGDTIVLANGTYSDKDCVLSGDGIENSQITVEAATVGGVKFHRPVTIEGNYITLKGFYFTGNNGKIEVYGNNVKVTRCTIDDSQASHWVRIQNYTKNCEFSYNTFKNKTNNATLPENGQLFNINKNYHETSASNHYIHHNYFKNIVRNHNGNGGETIQAWTDDSPEHTGPFGVDTHNRIEYNLFEEANGDPEIISSKSNGNIYSHNTIKNSDGSIWLRHGINNTVDNNYIFSSGGDGGSIRVHDKGNTITNNYIEGDDNQGAGIELGSGDGEGGTYIEADNAIVTSNIIVTSNYGIRTGRTSSDTQPSNVKIENNIIIDSRSQAFSIGAALPKATFSGNKVQGTLGDNPGGVTRGAVEVPSSTLDGVLTPAMVGAQATEELTTPPPATVPATVPATGPFEISPSGLK